MPLEDTVADVAVCCLSLMGLNWMDFVRRVLASLHDAPRCAAAADARRRCASREARRVLKPCGTLLVAEVASRMGEERGAAAFISAIEGVGFRAVARDYSRRLFYVFQFDRAPRRRGAPRAAPAAAVLKPCVYKKR